MEEHGVGGENPHEEIQLFSDWVIPIHGLFCNVDRKEAERRGAQDDRLVEYYAKDRMVGVGLSVDNFCHAAAEEDGDNVGNDQAAGPNRVGVQLE